LLVLNPAVAHVIAVEQSTQFKRGPSMTNTAMSAAFGEGDFRVGRVLSQSTSVFQRNFPALFVIGIVAYLPVQLFSLWFATQAQLISVGAVSAAQVGLFAFLFFFVSIVFSMLSQAIILHMAFQNMRNQSANIIESLKLGIRRFFPLLLLGICIGILMVLVAMGVGLAVGVTTLISGNTMSSVLVAIAAALLGLAALALLYTMWFVAVAACVVDRRWPFSALRRSAQLTKGFRWRIFGLLLLLLVTSTIVSLMIRLLASPLGGIPLTFVAGLAWAAVIGAFYAIVVAVSYHDLRVAKEGMDIEQIASVFD
jgi:hypothetical protein